MHALEKADVWDRMGLPQEACRVMQKVFVRPNNLINSNFLGRGIQTAIC